MKKSEPNYKGEYFRNVFTYNGKRYDIAAKTPEDLYLKVAEKKRQLENGDIVINNNTTVGKWIEQWLLMDKKPKLQERSFIDLESLVNNHIVPNVGHLKLKDVKRINLQQILNSQSGKSFSHLSKLKIYMNEIFNAAERDELIDKNPARFLTLPDNTKGSVRAMTDEEYNKALEILPNFENHGIKFVKKTEENKQYLHRAGIWMLLLLKCGLRRSESVPLKWSDIDFKTGEIKINKAVQFINGKPKFKSKTKTYRSKRNLIIPDDVLLLLKEEKQLSDNELIFPNNIDNDMMSEWHMDKLWKNFYRCLDIELGATVYRNKIIESKIAPDLSLHSLRHTCVTRLVIKGANIKDVQIFAGHADVSTTLNVYTNVTNADAIQRIYQIESGTKSGNEPINTAK